MQSGSEQGFKYLLNPIKGVERFASLSVSPSHSKLSKNLVKNHGLWMETLQGERALLGDSEYFILDITGNGS